MDLDGVLGDTRPLWRDWLEDAARRFHSIAGGQDFTAGKLAVALAYAIGSGAVLYALMLGGRRVADRLNAVPRLGPGRRRGGDGRGRAGDDRRPRPALPEAIADDLPAVLVNPSGELEESGAVAERARRGARRPEHRRSRAAAQAAAAGSRRCPTTGRRPTSPTPSEWFNTERRAALDRRADRRRQGRADRLLDLHLHQLHPHAALPDRPGTSEYRDDGLTIVGVHAPEFAFEKDAGNVADAIAEQRDRLPGRPGQRARHLERVRQPVLARQVPDRRRRPGPLRPLRRGRLRADRGGDPLAARRGRRSPSSAARPARAAAETADPRLRTPETYLGCERAQGWVEPPRPGEPRLRSAPDRASSSSTSSPRRSLAGRRRVGDVARRGDALARASRRGGCSSSSARARRAAASSSCCSTASRSRRRAPGEDVCGAARRRSPTSASTGSSTCPTAGRHTLELRFEPGISGYAFTFG